MAHGLPAIVCAPPTHVILQQINIRTESTLICLDKKAIFYLHLPQNLYGISQGIQVPYTDSSYGGHHHQVSACHVVEEPVETILVSGGLRHLHNG